MTSALKRHWPEYLMEAAGLGLFMLSACLFGALLQLPSSPVRQALSDATFRRALMGLAMGATAAAIIYSPWGRRSGAHINPSVTLAFLRLGKIRGWDAFFYVGAQFLGGLAGVLLAALILGRSIGDPALNYVATVPGVYGPRVAFVAELIMAFGLMSVVLAMGSRPSLEHATGAGAAVLVALYIAAFDPLSGMSINPARTFASALPAGTWTAAWVYFIAPPLGMLLAAEAHRAWSGRTNHCAKLEHRAPCIFCNS